MLWMCTLASLSSKLCFKGTQIPWTLKYRDPHPRKSLKCWFWGCLLHPSPCSIGNLLISTAWALSGSLSNSWEGVVSVYLQVEKNQRLGLCLWGIQQLYNSVTLCQTFKPSGPCSASFTVLWGGWSLPWTPRRAALLRYLFPFPSLLYNVCGTSWRTLFYLVLSVFETQHGLSPSQHQPSSCLVNVDSFFQIHFEGFLPR